MRGEKGSRTGRPHIHIEDHKMTGERVFNGNISKTVDGINRFINALHFAIHSMINAVPSIRKVVNVKSESQSIGEVFILNVLHHLFQLFLFYHDCDTHRPTNQMVR